MAVLSLFAASGLFATSGMAQTTTTTTTTTTTPDEPQVLEKYVVTGSNIPQAADALSVPVLVVDQTVIDNSGVSADTLDLLRKVAPNISGIGEENAQIATGSNFGGASVNIKGLPTLVLLDGRRVANDPAESVDGSQFVDLNLIPVAAIDRIEILQDGASAIYGSDAIGGVINIILKKNYNGSDTGVDYGFSRNAGHYAERSGYVVTGASTDTTSITLGDNINYGFGLAGIDPAVDEGGFLFNFSISLINDGTPITDPFGFTAINPFGFSVDKVGTGTSATITGGTFNEIDVVVTGPLDPTVTNFGVGVGNQVTTVPDTAMTAALVALGLVAIVAFGRRGSLLTRRS